MKNTAKSVLCLIMAFLVLPLFATTFKKVAFQKMIDNSDLVIKGTCQKTKSRLVGGQIMTFARVKVDRVLKGSLESDSENVDIAYIGGEITEPAPLGAMVPGGVSLDPTDKTYLLLKKVDSAKKGAFSRAATVAGSEQPLYKVNSLGMGVMKIDKGNVRFKSFQKHFKKELAVKKLRLNSKNQKLDQAVLNNLTITESDFEEVFTNAK